MAAYKDEARGTWYVSFHYNDWTGKNKRKLKRGFRTRREALEYEQKFLLQQATRHPHHQSKTAWPLNIQTG